jgi:spore germination cell wall hydrolase CwlJ-like protein
MSLDQKILVLAATVAVVLPLSPATMASTPKATETVAGDNTQDPPSAAADVKEATEDSGKGTEQVQTEAEADEEAPSGERSPEKGEQPRKSANGKSIDAELRCLALNIYHEARSESKTGQEAIAAVTLNRVESTSFPNSVCKVVKQGGQKRNRCQFSWFCDGRSDHPTERSAWRRALDISRESLLGVLDDPTNGATFYHTNKVRPSWTRKLHRTARIGDHIFYSLRKHRSVKVASAK